MRAIEVDRHPSRATRQAIAGFVDEVSRQLGERPVSDHTWLATTADPAPPLAAVIARQVSPEITEAHAEPPIIGVALVTTTNDGQMLEVVVAPGVVDHTAVLSDLGETACELGRDRAGTLTWWIDDPPAEVVAVAAEHGLAPRRQLHELRRPLPTEWRSSVSTRAFRPGTDDDTWLTVNNRAFASHPEQGGWTRELLESRMAEAWFDPGGLRLYEVGDQLAGFCWTKIHDRGADRVGEIYVIGVDPSHQGAGLGRQLTLAGLDWLADHGATQAMLYVDAANLAAMRTYLRLGFEVARTRTALTTVQAMAH
jgi:mycothiol synthase